MSASNRRRESPSGQSYYGLYQNCPRKFYIKYPLGIMSKHTSIPLLTGGAFHEGKATWYKTGDMNKALRKVKSTLTSVKDEFIEEQVYEDTKERTVRFLSAWIYDWGEQDLKLYKPLEIECQHRVVLPNGFYLTIRPDGVLKRKDDGRIFIVETKTTGFSKLVAAQGVYYGDQATAYLWALSQVHPKWKIEGVIADISYWHKASSDDSKIVNERDAIVKRSKEQLGEFALSTMNILSDISQRIQALKTGIHPLAVFPRNTQWCTSFFRPCEYAEICRTQLVPGEIPAGFRRDPWAEEHRILEFPKIQGVKHGQVCGKKEKAGKVQVNMRSNTADNLTANYIRNRLSRYTVLKNPGRGQDLVALDSLRRERNANLLRSWIFCRLPQVRRKRIISTLSNGYGGKENVKRLPGRMDRVRSKTGRKV